MKYISKKTVFIVFSLLIVFGGISCSDSSGSSDSKDPVVTSSLSGTIAGGAAVAGTVYVKDSTGAVKSSAINADGSYSINVSGMTAPFLIYAEGTCGSQSVSLYSYAEGPGRANVTPITTMIVAMAALDDPEELYPPVQMKGSAPLTNAMPSSSAVATAVQTVVDLFEEVYDDFSIAGGFNPLTGSFTVGTAGFDTLLDTINFDVEESTVTITDTLTGTVVYSDDVADDTDTPVNNIADLYEIADAIVGINAVISQWESLANQYLAGSITLSAFQTQFNALLSDDFAQGDDDGVLNRSGFVTSSVELVQNLEEYDIQRIEISVKVHQCPMTASISEGEYGYGLRYGIMSFSYYGAGDVLIHRYNDMMTFKEESGNWKLCGNRKYAASYMTAVHHKEIRSGQEPEFYTGIDIGFDWELADPPMCDGNQIDMMIVIGDGILSSVPFMPGQQGLVFQLNYDDLDEYYFYSDANFSRNMDLYYGEYISNTFFDPELVEDKMYLFLGLTSSYELCCFWLDSFYNQDVNPSEIDQSKFMNFDSSFDPTLEAMGITGELSAENQWNLSLDYSESTSDPENIQFFISGSMSVDSSISYYDDYFDYYDGEMYGGPEDALSYNADTNSIDINIWNFANGEYGFLSWYSGSDVTVLSEDIGEMYVICEGEDSDTGYITEIYFKEY